MMTRDDTPPRIAATIQLALLAACGKQPATGDATAVSEERYRAHIERLSSDEHDPGWNVSSTLADLALFYDVGRAVATESGWPQWSDESEFRAIREASRSPEGT